MSLDPITEADMQDHYARNLQLPIHIKSETLNVPVVSSQIIMWEGLSEKGSELVPHLHFTCPQCQDVHNVDLEEGDSNPRFACCNSCVWDSLVWIEWNEAELKEKS